MPITGTIEQSPTDAYLYTDSLTGDVIFRSIDSNNFIFGFGSNRMSSMVLKQTGLFLNGSNDSSIFAMHRTRANNTSVQTSDGIGTINFNCRYGASASNTMANIQCIYTGNGTNKSGDLTFSTECNAGLTERLRINNIGNIGIGASNPTGRLHICPVGGNNGPRFDNAIVIDWGSNSLLNAAPTGYALRFDNSSLTSSASNSLYGGIILRSYNTTGTGIFNFEDRARVGMGFVVRNGLSSNIEAVSIDNSGNIGIGTTSPTYKLQLSTDSAAKPSTNTWTVSSDKRLKEDIQLANLGQCYSNIKDIPLKYFKWRDEIYTAEQVKDRHKLGWIAQDVEQVFPNSVEKVAMHGYNDCRTLNSDQLIASLFGCVKHLQSMVETLQKRIDVLEKA
jgi:Chaperone of endosialidase